MVAREDWPEILAISEVELVADLYGIMVTADGVGLPLRGRRLIAGIWCGKIA